MIKVNGRRIHEHRYIMEQHLGRPLLATEHVHHKDGDGLNNDPSNLELLTVAEHATVTAKELYEKRHNLKSLP